MPIPSQAAPKRPAQIGAATPRTSLHLKPATSRIPLTARERAEAEDLTKTFASGFATPAEIERLRELDRIGFINGELLHHPAGAIVEIWLRSKGSRRQAYFRQSTATTWQDMHVGAADKALRDGSMSLPGGQVAPAVAFEEHAEASA